MRPAIILDNAWAGWWRKLDQPAHDLGEALVLLKTAALPEKSLQLQGKLYASKSGWILLSVPNSLVRGAFDALDETGIQLPHNSDGSLNAHISVIRPEEIEQIGGLDKITERGHSFHYGLGPVQEVKPLGWAEMSKVWFLSVTSPELQALRKSYGLTPLPLRGQTELPFHITIARRPIGVLGRNETSKAA